MSRRFHPPLGLAIALALGAFACSKQQPALYGSSAGQGAYALRYVDAVAAARTEVAAIESQVARAKTDLAGYPDALQEPSWAHVKIVYVAADEAGRTAAYVEELERSETVARFYVDEKDALNRKVGGAAQHAAKEKNCDVELYGPTGYALGKGIEERIEERLRDRSEAHRIIDDYEEALGKKNRTKLEDQSDSIARASYLAHVALARLKERLEAQVNDASGVDSTLERVAEDARARAADTKLPQADRAKAKESEQAAVAARAKLSAEVAEAKKLVPDMDKRISALRKTYEDAFEALEDAVEAREKATKK